MAATNHERVGRALALLSEGVAPYVARECEAEWGGDWLTAVQRTDTRQGGVPPNKVSATDSQFLLKVMWDEWRTVFGKKLSQSERTLVSELRNDRNRWAHQEAFSTDDAYRTLDSVHRLLTAVSAADQATAVDKMRHDLLRSRFDEQARQTQRKRAVAAVEGQPAGGLKPWREVVTPHPDVASGRYQQAEFAADLHQVWRGDAADEYGDPAEFFRRTFLTDGLRSLLCGAVRRFSGDGGDPVVELQTNFGGGKTHSLIALYHLASGAPVAELAGVEAMLSDEGLSAPPGDIQRAVLVGQMISPGMVHTKDDGTEVRTLWGELAWQLGGAEAYATVAESDASGTSPGDALVALLEAHSPCLILIDEWVAYARQLYGVDGLPAGSFDAQVTFAQALAEAARSVPGAALVVSIPSSDIEVGGEGGQAALDRLKNVIGRMESSWRPASPDEGFEIVRRRLFEDLPGEAAPHRDAVVKAFGELYRSQSAEFPPGVREGDYQRRLTAAYPIHPELFDRLYEDWSTLDKFQRTRGVLRLMAAVIHELWERGDASLLIMPATVPIDAGPVQSELTHYLEDGWIPVIETDVDGHGALPLQIDRDNPGTLGRYSAARRVARTIYLGSAPIQAAANRGIDDRRVKLGCVQPGEGPATFGDALRRLTDQATYLYVDGQRYWYSLQPNVTRLAHDRAQSDFGDDQVDEEIRRRLGAQANQRGDFTRVHAAPRSPADVPDEAEVRLVVLGPEFSHSSKSDDSPARTAAERFLTERASGDRTYRNMLVFCCADTPRLVDLRSAVREKLAWDSILSDFKADALTLDGFQQRQTEKKVADSDEVVVQRIAETFVWLLTAEQSPEDPTGPLHWDETRVSGQDALAVRVSKKLKGDEGMITEYSGARLRMDLDRVPLWRGDHVGVRQLWDDYAQYLYLPRLATSAVLLDAIRDGVASMSWSPDTFAYAAAFDGETGRYVDLVGGEQPSVLLDAAAVVVKPDVASVQLNADRTESEGAGGGATDGERSAERFGGDGGGTSPPPPKGDPTRFYGRKTLDVLRLGRDIGDIHEAIVNQLAKAGGDVTVTVEIEASTKDGFADDARRTVGENARTLKFDTSEFED